MNKDLAVNNISRINELHVMASRSAAESRTRALSAVDWAWECGKLLNEEKAKLRHGSWLLWLRANCPLINVRTAERYMACAARYATMEDLKAAREERLFVCAGVLEEVVSSGAGQVLPKTDEGLLFVQRACQYFNKHDLTKLNDVGRSTWCDRLKPLAELYVRLGGRL